LLPLLISKVALILHVGQHQCVLLHCLPLLGLILLQLFRQRDYSLHQFSVFTVTLVFLPDFGSNVTKFFGDFRFSFLEHCADVLVFVGNTLQ
jgi:hypothetical protein